MGKGSRGPRLVVRLALGPKVIWPIHLAGPVGVVIGWTV